MKFTETHCKRVGDWYVWGQVYRVADEEAWSKARDFVEDQLAFQEISEFQYKISEEIDE
jgi:hypothetical protein